MNITPCIKICQLDDNKTCLGCKRTIIQIKNWKNYSYEEKLQIMKQLEIENSNPK